MKKMNGGTDPKKKMSDKEKAKAQLSREKVAKDSNKWVTNLNGNASRTDIKKDSGYIGGAIPRVGGSAPKASGLKGASKAQVKASKKYKVNPTVSKQMRKYTKKG